MSEPRRRLDQPVAPRGLRRPRISPEAVGSAAETIARFFGTARYLFLQTLIVIIWIGINAVWGINYANHKHHGNKPFDPYPFILLNLAFSTQAAYAAPLILLAQNRQADRDRIQADADRIRDDRAIADAEYLAREIASIRIALGDVVTRDYLRSELARLERVRDGRDDRDG
ncbi:DUF1003 domain-containing protein [Jatrophihabitans sp.]|uniref:DUF1003 domain-containing protein n=1 Tax=Jatrophihabitans sp. TaxID=1932789 RepID=UPI002EDC3934